MVFLSDLTFLLVPVHMQLTNTNYGAMLSSPLLLHYETMKEKVLNWTLDFLQKKNTKKNNKI